MSHMTIIEERLQMADLLVRGPLFVELLGEVTLLPDDLRCELLRVERELDAQFRVEVDKWI